MTPEFLTVGHVAWDQTAQGPMLGGTAAYASITALRLGLRPALVTSHSTDLDPALVLPGVRVHSVPSVLTTSFRNTYVDGARTQLLMAVAETLTETDLPDEFLAAPLVLLGPLAGEVTVGLARAFPRSEVMACLQGWLRVRGQTDLVLLADWEGTEVLPVVSAAVVSAEDVPALTSVDRWKTMVPVLAVTEGRAGARVHRQDEWHRVDSYTAQEVDPTGAGDVFAAAYLVRYGETSDPLESAKFAACAASFCVEAHGTAGIPSRQQVEERLAADGR